MDEKEEKDLFKQLGKMEGQLNFLVSNCTQCRATMVQHGEAIVRIDASVRSAHKRIDGIYKSASGIAVLITLLINLAVFVATHLNK